MTDKELLDEIAKCENKVSSLDTFQQAIKVMINSLYGAAGNPHFRYYDKRMAEGITLSGQLAVLWMMRKFNIMLNKLFETQTIDYVIYSDTDSVAGTSMIEVNNELIKIENLFENTNSSSKITPSGNEVKTTNNCWTTTVDDSGKLVKRRIKYVMRHKVKKRMYKILAGDASVTITEDHSIIINRNGKIIEAKVNNIIKGDKIIYVK